MEWQPIETAPKDTFIMIYACGWQLAHFDTNYGRWCTYTDGTGTAGEMMLNRNGPTHWQYLPDGPDGQIAPGK